MNMHLSEDQISQFRTEGFCFPGRILDDETLDMIRAEELRFRNGVNPLAIQAGIEEPVGASTIFRSQVAAFSQPVRKLGTEGAHIDLAEQLIGPNILFWFSQFVTKFPDADSSSGQFPWHQDNGYVNVDPPTNITIWMALDDVDEENGCVYVQPRSHELGLLPHEKKSADSWFLDVPVEGDGVPAILKAGEAVIFTGLTLHRSKQNRTDKPRRALFFEYADASTRGWDKNLLVWSHSAYVVRGQAPLPAKTTL
jgi:hypothetical protein